MPALPQWIAGIDPLASIPRMLQGYATGAQIGESLRAGEQHAADQADANARFEAELAQREARAQQEYQLHQQLQQEKAETAARNLAGMQEYQSLVASGLPKESALMQAAPNLFYKQPDKLMNALHEFQLEAQAKQNADRMAKGQEATEAFRQSQVKHWDTTAAETERANREREKRLANPPATPKLFHVGNSLVRINPDGTQEILFTSNDPSKVDQWEHSELMTQLNASKINGIDSDAYKQAKDDLSQFKKRFSADKVPKPFQPTPASSRVRIRRKSDGAEFFYPNANEVPTDQFDILDQ